MTAPNRGRDDATIRGAVVLVVAIVIGLALLWRGGTGDDDGSTAAEGQSTVTDTSFTGDASTDADGSTVPPINPTTSGTDDTQPPGSVAVIVFNGTPERVPGIATEYTTKASDAGYETLDPSDAAATTETTTIYTAEGFELDAEAMKEVLGLPPETVVAAKPEEALGAGDDLADIVVVLGGDYGGGSGDTTTTDDGG